jgi:hypothetical protein
VRRLRVLLVASCLLITATTGTGCGREERAGVPVACREGQSAVLAALRAAPGEVRLDGTRLSACLARESDGGELRDVGTAFLEAAATLARSAQARPDGPEATQLGYLMGAVRRSGPADQGVNYELVRRLEQELLALDTATAAFRRGERAGRADG